MQCGQLPVTQNWGWKWLHILRLAEVQHWFGQGIDPSSSRKVILAEGLVFFTASQFMSYYFQDRDYEMLSGVSQCTLTCNVVSLRLPLHWHMGTNYLCHVYVKTQKMLLPFSLLFCLKFLDLDGPPASLLVCGFVCLFVCLSLWVCGKPFVILQWRCVCPAHAGVQIFDNKQCTALRVISLLLLLLGSECQGCDCKQDFYIWWVVFPQFVALWDEFVFWFKVPYASKCSPQIFSFPLFEDVQNVLLTQGLCKMLSPEKNSVVNCFEMCIEQGEVTFFGLHLVF